MPSFHKDKNSGLWSCRFREVDLETGKTRQPRLSGFKTKKEAQYAYEDYITEYAKKKEAYGKNKAQAKTALDMTFGELTRLFFKFKEGRIKDTTYYDLSKKMERRIFPFFEKKKIRDITPAVILEWQDTVKDMSYNYQKGLHTLLSAIYSYGERYHDIPNVMNKIERPRKKPEDVKEISFYSPEEFEQFIKHVEKKQYRTFFEFLYISGCRRGEALALTWSDVNLTTGAVSIKKSVAFKVHDGDNAYRITSPKNTSSIRTIYIPVFFRERLQAYKAWQAQNYTTEGFIFCGSSPLPATSIDREIRTASAAAGVKRIGVHGFRHSNASLLLHKGASIVAVSKHLGHKNTQQTLNTYAHMLPDDRSIILNNLETLNSLLSE